MLLLGPLPYASSLDRLQSDRAVMRPSTAAAEETPGSHTTPNKSLWYALPSHPRHSRKTRKSHSLHVGNGTHNVRTGGYTSEGLKPCLFPYHNPTYWRDCTDGLCLFQARQLP